MQQKSDLGLHCLPMSHKKDARLIWVKCSLKTFRGSSKNPFKVGERSGSVVECST